MQHPIIQTIKSRMAVVKSLDDLVYLDLSHIQCKELPLEAKNLLERCRNLQELNLNHCGLESLDNLPCIEITILQLGSNKLADHQLSKLALYEFTLQQINLQHNHLTEISNIGVFQSFQRLEQIDIKGNPICSINSNYNQRIFAQILLNHPKLKIVDCYRKNGEIISDDEGKDQDLDGPLWMLSQNIQEERSHKDDSSFRSQEKSSSQQAIQQNTKVMRLYEKYQKPNPGFLLKYLNQNERFVDPIDNCLDQDIQFEDDHQQEFKNEIQNEGFKCKQSKKRKSEFRFDQNYDY